MLVSEILEGALTMATLNEFLLLARFKGELPLSETTTNPLTGVCSPVLCTPPGGAEENSSGHAERCTATEEKEEGKGDECAQPLCRSPKHNRGPLAMGVGGYASV